MQKQDSKIRRSFQILYTNFLWHSEAQFKFNDLLDKRHTIFTDSCLNLKPSRATGAGAAELAAGLVMVSENTSYFDEKLM